MRGFYSQDMIDYIDDHFGILTKKEISDGLFARFNVRKSESAIESILNRLKLKKGRRSKEKQPKVYTPEIMAFVREKYKNISVNDLLILINEKFETDFKRKNVRSMLGKAKLRSGLNRGYNLVSRKGVKTKPNKTSFQKGNHPPNKKEIGYERIDKRGYTHVKVANPNVFKPKHRVIYEAAYGKIQKGCEVIFKDGNKQNFEIDNLVMLTRTEKAFLQNNKYLSMPVDFVDTLILLSKLQSKLVAGNN